ncbi:diaminopimelate epimerase [Paenibacillus beijingensis]|uniref:Diaminopimelate epimerase n=1 Tax=Paenibacillus beijingensis TaxID=1126833 RepID=A0A0D5NN64_9BACL|nr:diaminopimelate epimerase [Paenibacillus beijingensis]AJY76452.1 diaminopimelate epimerase [Paenibacillus beijingensis]
MDFTKMHGLGNDFVVIAGETALPEGADALAVRLCDRNFGIGADGLVFILPSDSADFMMRIINSDGSEAEQCGNAIRCVAKYVYDNGLTDKETITIETLGAGAQQVQLTVENGKAAAVRVDMGRPVLAGLEVPTTVDADPVIGHPIEVDGREFRFTAVSMGNPHCVIFVDDAAGFDLHTWGPKLEVHPLFPRKTNVEFVSVTNRSHADMRVWERGAGPTLACGTGACATVVASVLNGLTDRTATVSLKGGDLLIEWSESDNRVYMTGPAAEVFRGSLQGGLQ